MIEAPERLSTDTPIVRLLDHYAEAGLPDRQIWQDRVMEMEGVEIRQLVRLHGELIAQGWIEQNTGATPQLKPGVAASCYRITPAGYRAWKERQ